MKVVSLELTNNKSLDIIHPVNHMEIDYICTVPVIVLK